jgi:type IV secretory pathway TrbF-like protein
MLLSLILAAGVVWQSTRSRFIPYVVEVDKLGYGLTVPKPPHSEHGSGAR